MITFAAPLLSAASATPNPIPEDPPMMRMVWPARVGVVRILVLGFVVDWGMMGKETGAVS